MGGSVSERSGFPIETVEAPLKPLLLFLGLISVMIGGCRDSSDGASGVTVAQLAGTWDYAGSAIDTACFWSLWGTAAIAANGLVTLSETRHSTNPSCGTVSVITSGTLTINQAGTGTIALTTGETYDVQVSTDLNTLIMADITTSTWSYNNTALRR